MIRILRIIANNYEKGLMYPEALGDKFVSRILSTSPDVSGAPSITYF
ncbi:hypothetical protein Q2T40_20780 [Winogradskyella maritima]|uniref:Uncharacterized protein n=1 Tax=Winogradskyella maritima TaxID=1517766 RepID=A0ABV8AJR5_9FLAO|nr:hypothetical protein [Winogradskyella maritima]MDO1502579.1 hypothetical protein [Winogradskyella maritima]